MGFIMIAKYITTFEYECHCCGKLPPEFENHTHPMVYDLLFDSFEIIREAFGSPIRISSGYRCPSHNSFVGGKPLSAHLFGLALDLATAQDTEQVFQIIEKETPHLRVGRYPTFLHLDVAYAIHPRVMDSWVKGARWK